MGIFVYKDMERECNNCPRKCGQLRKTAKGYCQIGDQIVVALASVHHGEEPIISGTKGSGTIFFSGCNMRCVFCQNYGISHHNWGKPIDAKRLSEIFRQLESKGVHNINLVSPSIYVDQIIDALNIYRPNIPIVYNTNGYDSVESIEKLKGYVDIFLTDLKYTDDNLAKTYSDTPDYFEVASNAILAMRKCVSDDVIEDGVMKKGLIVRHLVLPNHTDDSLRVLDWIKANLGTKTIVSVMSQYTPLFDAKNYEKLSRPLKKLEYKRVLTHFNSLSFENGYMQELTSSGTENIPRFDGSGV